MPGVYAPHGVLLDAAGALQTRCAQTVQIPFSAASPVLGCVPMGILSSPPPICPAAPRRRGRKRRGNCLRAKPEFFRVPPSARSKGSPQGQDWLGCHFLVSSFGHAKEERKQQQKDSSRNSGEAGIRSRCSVTYERSESERFLAEKAWQWIPELAKTTTAGYWRDLKFKARQPYGCAGS